MKLVRTVGSKIVIRADLQYRVLSQTLNISEEKPTFIGTVEIIGPDVKHIKVGDRVHYGNDRQPIKIDSSKADIVIINEDDVFVVLED